MKELSLEEKAKRYDEAIEIAKEINNERQAQPFNVMTKVFPELAESEDEKIRKHLLKLCDRWVISGVAESFETASIKVDNILAWLERQGEKDEEILILKDQIESLHAAIIALKEAHKIELEKQGTPQVRTGLEWVNTIDDACDKRYSEEYAHGEYCHEQSFKWGFQEGVDWLEKQGKNNMGISEATKKKLEDNLNKALEKETAESFNEFLDEQKPAWSEEDEELLNTIINHFKVNVECTDDDDIIKWLKSLKDRVQPQPMQEWSEEDEEMLENIICDINTARQYVYVKSKCDEETDWLKSLRPKTTWKPSDEQMADLWNMVCECRPADQQLLQDLYFGLKTLRGE